MRRRGASPAAIYAIPAAVAFSGLVGLGSGLIGDGGFDTLSWVALSVPLVVVARAAVRRG